MSNNPQQRAPKPAPESLPGSCNKWAPGSWAAAAAYNATKPAVRCPVIVGGNGNMIQTPEQLCDLCQLPSVPSLTETTETTLSLFPEEQDHRGNQGKEMLYVADVSLRQFLNLQKCTEGDLVVVWYRGERRYAWLARAMKGETTATKDSMEGTDGLGV